MVPLPMRILLRYLLPLSTAFNSVIKNLDGSFQFFVARWASAIPSSGIRLLPFPAPSGCRTARPHLGERWSSRLVAAASTDWFGSIPRALENVPRNNWRQLPN